MKAFVFVLAVLAVCCGADKLQDCGDTEKPGDIKVSRDWVSMTNGCVGKMKEQIKAELHASLTYLSMASYFSLDKVNRPGFAKLFFDSASEEREHAIKLIEYLSMRGELTEEAFALIPEMPNMIDTRLKPAAALAAALELENTVTNLIRGVIVTCEADTKATDLKQDVPNHSNDYHLVDYLTGEFLEEQYKGQREIAGRLSTLLKMVNGGNGEVGEFLFDKKLLNGEI